MFPGLGMKGLCGDIVEELKMAEERKIPEGCLGSGGGGNIGMGLPDQAAFGQKWRCVTGQ